MVKKVKTMLYKKLEETPNVGWTKQLPGIMYAHNIASNKSRGHAVPFEVIFGRQPRTADNRALMEAGIDLKSVLRDAEDPETGIDIEVVRASLESNGLDPKIVDSILAGLDPTAMDAEVTSEVASLAASESAKNCDRAMKGAHARIEESKRRATIEGVHPELNDLVWLPHSDSRDRRPMDPKGLWCIVVRVTVPELPASPSKTAPKRGPSAFTLAASQMGPLKGSYTATDFVSDPDVNPDLVGRGDLHRYLKAEHEKDALSSFLLKEKRGFRAEFDLRTAFKPSAIVDLKCG